MQHLDEGTLQAWLDRPRSGLSEEESLVIQAHLDTCDACAAALEGLANLGLRAGDILGHAEPGDVEAPDFAAVLERRGQLQQEGTATGSLTVERRLRSLAWAASLVLALGAGWIARDLYRSGSTNAGAGDVAMAPAAEARAATESLDGGTPPGGGTGDVPEAPVAAAAARVVQGGPSPSTDEFASDQSSELGAAPEPAPAAPTSSVEAGRRAELGVAATSADRVALEETVLTDAGDDDAAAGPNPGPDVLSSPDDPGPSVPFLVLSDLEVLEVEVLRSGEAVRVVQALDPSTRLVMVQGNGSRPDGLGDVPAGQPIQTVERDGLFIVGTAPIPADSLGVLLDALGR